MKTTPEHVQQVIERRGLDRLAAYDASGRHRFDLREGTTECRDAVAELVENTEGPFIVECWKHQARSGKRALSDQALRFRLMGAQVAAQSMNGTGAGPSWREFMELREQMIRAELQPKAEPDALAKLLPLAERLILGAAAKPQAIAQPTPPPAPRAKADKVPADLREALNAVVVIYRNDPETFRSYAPFMTAKAAEFTQPAEDNDNPEEDEDAPETE